jgi:hypothetical protein
MERKPILEVGIGDLNVKAMAFLSDVNGRVEPSLVAVPVDFLFDGFFDEKPRIRVLFVFHETALDFHRYFHTCGKPSVLLSDFCRECSDIIALAIFKFKEIVFFLEISFGREKERIRNRIRSKI